ncbi:MAG: hypothetical protein E7Z89_02035 [Cyanobacteria bacterium SIG28]|nr:hypothetical protein [Cyanobacteria bacterium SIG28]
MKKKFVSAMLICSMLSFLPACASSHIDRQIQASKKSNKYNSVKKHAAEHETNFYKEKAEDIVLKDPKLISFKTENVEKISDAKLEKKIQKDEAYYVKNVIPHLDKNNPRYNKIQGVDFYNLYRVAERVIRSNNLDYVNWRIVLVEDTDDFNAASTEANLIAINSALYDSLYNNNDALAYVISHEIAHQVLGHSQQKIEKRRRYATSNDIVTITTLGFGSLIYMPVSHRIMAKQFRAMEYEADTLGMEFLVRAGYKFEDAMAALNFMNSLPHTEYLTDYHPSPEKRIDNLKTVQRYFLSHWVDEGRYYFYNSKPLECKKSSDRVSIVISSSETSRDKNFTPEDTEELLKRVGYIDYKSGRMLEAIKYFTQWTEISSSYIPHLYLSYAYEYLYKQNPDKKLLKKAKEAAKMASAIAPKDENVKAQIADLVMAEEL